MSGAVANRHFDVRIGCFGFGFVSFAFQTVLLGIFRLFFIIGWEKDAVCLAFLLVFWITADREIGPILPGTNPLYHRLPTASLGGAVPP